MILRKRLACGLAAALVAIVPVVGSSAGVRTVRVKRTVKSKKWERKKTLTVADLPVVMVRVPALSEYGAREDILLGGTGFFRVEKYQDEWWLVDPEGYAFLSVGVNSVRPSDGPRSERAFRKKYGSKEEWARRTGAGLLDSGFNTIGCWSHWKDLREVGVKMAYTRQWDFLSAARKKFGRSDKVSVAVIVLDPKFTSFCRRYARGLVETKDDPWLLGHFSDNEIRFRMNDLDSCLGLDERDPVQVYVQRWINRRHQAMAGSGRLSKADREAFLERIVGRYYRIVGKAMRASDPNHLLLGTRIHGRVKGFEIVFREAGKHCDVISVNDYHVWTPTPERIDGWVAWSGRPILITEWYAKGADTGLRNDTGAGWLVRTQGHRAAFYENFMLGLLKSPGCVGAHWFRYMDNDPAGSGGISSNRGMLSSSYVPYQKLIDSMKLVNTQAYVLRDRFGAERNR